MITIQEYLLSKSNPKISMIKATDETIHQIVKNELDRLGHDADLNHIDVSEVTKMNGVFSCDHDDLGSTYNDLNPDISKWEVNNVEDMRYMFYRCKKFNCDIGGWITSKLKDANGMFFHCENFNCDISSWNVRSVQHMVSMFDGCIKFNQDLSQWDVSSVQDTTYIFYDCPIKEEYKPKFK